MISNSKVYSKQKKKHENKLKPFVLLLIKRRIVFLENPVVYPEHLVITLLANGVPSVACVINYYDILILL